MRRADEAFADWWAVEVAAGRLQDSDPDRAQAIYEQGTKQSPQAAPLLLSYALFLLNIPKDPDRAEEHFRRALEVDPKDADYLGNYATFLAAIRKDYDRAEEHFRRALEADPKQGNVLGNYTGFLLGRGRHEEGLALLDRALATEGLSENPALAAECWFYSLVHRPPEKRAEALEELKKILLAGGRSPGWDLGPHLAQAKARGRADLPWLEKLVAVISDGADIATLDGWAEWSKAS